MQSSPDGTTAPAAYAERLRVPLRWWVQATMFLASIWLAFIVALPEWIAWTAAGVLTAATYGMFLLIGGAQVVVRDTTLYAGTAHIGLVWVKGAEALDAENSRRVLGVDADARAFLLTRPYLKKSVRVWISDPDDPTPYWLISTRHPDQLVAALTPAPATD